MYNNDALAHSVDAKRNQTLRSVNLSHYQKPVENVCMFTHLTLKVCIQRRFYCKRHLTFCLTSRVSNFQAINHEAALEATPVETPVFEMESIPCQDLGQRVVEFLSLNEVNAMCAERIDFWWWKMVTLMFPWLFFFFFFFLDSL